jgi:hypothetical protein
LLAALGRHISPAGLDPAKLFCRHLLMIARFIPEPAEPEGSPNESEDG